NGAGLTSLNASNVSSGTLNDARLSNNVALLNALQTFSGANTFSNAANSFTGSGAGLTSLNASNISSGTLNDARLSTNVALLNAANVFTAKQTVPAAVAGAASLTVTPSAVTPTTPVAGDIWNAGLSLRFRDNA